MLKKQEISDRNWDYLIVLDACRFDFFKKIYDKFFNRKVEPRKSRGSTTPEWAKKTFKEHYDLTYFSANPFISNSDIPFKRLGAVKNYDWSAQNHFSEVIDVWRSGWNEEIGTIPPKELNLAFLKNKPEKAIIHYIQPHEPYITLEKDFKLKLALINEKKDNKSLKKLIGNHILKKLSREKQGFIRKNYWGLRKLSGKAPKNAFEFFWRNGNAEKYYLENLKIVLRSVKNLIDELEGTIIITSDHGELLGEYNIWGHYHGSEKKELIKVPWLKMKK
ncbi:hypothetical protein C9439_03980 [archaeon SCG-AAA382B04]|nr:hypothetical protein C9439_03980 [archaeon SCG-AAA382B04]